MSYTFRMTFSGLCAFVPRVKDGETSPRRVDVLIVKDQEPDTAGGRWDQSPDYDAHSAEIGFPVRQLQPGGDPNSDVLGRWELENEEVRLFVRRAGEDDQELNQGLTVMEGGRDATQDCPPSLGAAPYGTNEARDYYRLLSDVSWIPQVEKALPGAGTISRENLLSTPSSDVAARFVLESGILGTDAIGQFLDGWVIAQFVPPPNGAPAYSQALAHRVVLEVVIDDGSSVVIKATDFSAGTTRELVLAPVAGALLQVDVTNLCCGYYATAKGSPTAAPEPDHDFAEVYRLSADYAALQKANLWLPVPVPVQYVNRLPTSATGGVTPIKCSGAWFEPAGLP